MKVTVLKSGQPISDARWANSEVDDNFEAFVGRSEDCHVRIDDPLVSRHLFVLRQEQGRWWIERLSAQARLAKNGDAFDAKTTVASGDVIQFAPYVLQIDDLPSFSSATGQYDNLPDDDIPSTSAMEMTSVSSNTIKAPRLDLPDDDLSLPDDDLSLPDEESLTETVPMDGMDNDFNHNPTIGGHAVDDLGFGGDEDVIGSMPEEQDSEEPAFNPETGEVVENNGDFTNDATLGDLVPNDEPEQGTQVLKRFVNFELHLFGEHAPYDRYVIDGQETLIGRDSQKCQIVLHDSEVSSVHAIIRKGFTSLTLEDQNSSNGTLLNGQRINKTELSQGDEFIVGSTTFTVHVSSDLLDAEHGRLMPVESGQVVERIEEVEEDAAASEGEQSAEFGGLAEPEEKSIFKRIWKDPKKKRIAIFLLLLVMGLSLLEDEKTTTQPEKKETKPVPAPSAQANVKKLSPDEIRALEARYKIAEAFIKEKKLDEALAELEQIMAVDDNYKNVKTLYRYVMEQNAKFKAEQERLQMEAARAQVREQVKELLTEAKATVAARNVIRSEQLFTEILTLDPENLEVTPLKQELELWQSQEKLAAAEKARVEAARKKMVDQLQAGKTHYVRREWYRAIVKLDEFLQIKGMDEDLTKEATEMITDARTQLNGEVAPLLGKARSQKEGQDLKVAYESYLDVLKVDPINAEALNEVDGIRALLESRSKKVYREAIISESLSLFGDAKEKLQEVQQISPTDSDYYKKATEKLKDYLE